MPRSSGSNRAGSAPSQRQLRVGEEIRHLLAGALSRGDLRDPGVHGRVITVTEVRISPDLRNATAFIVPLGGNETETVLPALKRVAPYLRGVIGRDLNLRHVPQLSFEADHSFDYAARIDALLRTHPVQQDLPAKNRTEEDSDL